MTDSNCLADDTVKLAPTVKFNNGYEVPVVGLGTYAVSTLLWS